MCIAPGLAKLVALTKLKSNSFGEPDAVALKPIRFEVKGGRLALRLPPKSVTVVRVN